MSEHDCILIIDDIPENLRVLDEILSPFYKVKAATKGATALKIANKKPYPDLILLDVMMPEMDGYEVCRRLKNDPETQDIPIIFVTAMGETEDETYGLELGAQDYITKPINADLVLARVKVHIELQKKSKKLANAYKQLTELEEMRTNLVQMLVHDLRCPLSIIVGTLDLIPNLCSSLSEKEKKIISRCHHSSVMLIDMISAILDVNKMEEKTMNLDYSKQEIVKTMEAAKNSLVWKEDQIHCNLDKPIAMVNCDHEIIRRVIVNILANAVMLSPKYVKLEGSCEDEYITISITDKGPGIPESEHHKIFEKFGRCSEQKVKRRYSTGLGLHFCKLAIEEHGGQIGLKSKLGEGTTFWFKIPLMPEQSN